MAGPAPPRFFRPLPLIVSRGRSESSNNKVLRVEEPEILLGAHRGLTLRFRHRLWGESLLQYFVSGR